MRVRIVDATSYYKTTTRDKFSSMYFTLHAITVQYTQKNSPPPKPVPDKKTITYT